MIFLVVGVLLVSSAVARNVLTPSFFDIGKERRIEATATCGEDFQAPGGALGERYCTLAGISCDYCVPGSGDKDHNVKKANDGTNRWWQSPPLSRGANFRKINISIDFEQRFHVAYVIIKSANSPRPGVWALERSNDYGRTFTPWHYFAPSPVECREYFSVDSYAPIVRDDTVICSTEYSKIPPFENGEIHLSMINGRPGASNFALSNSLQEWTAATNIRLRFLDFRTLLSDLLPLSLEDPTITGRYYYSIKDITIGGRCICNGFAEECSSSGGKYHCRCQFNTEGETCNRCIPGFQQYAWRSRKPGNAFSCGKCNCHGHTEECYYDDEVARRRQSLDSSGRYSGGGVCRNCVHNTEGNNCERCKPTFYRAKGAKLTDKNVCQSCNCDTRFSTGLCADETGQCECKANYAGRYCNQCAKGYSPFPACTRCRCNVKGSREGECNPDKDVKCRCNERYSGPLCNQCDPNHYNFPECTDCGCLVQFGAADNHCDRFTGQCKCKVGFTGRQCERCAAGFHKFPFCKECECERRTATAEVCESGSGTCICRANFVGEKCDSCAPGHYGYPSCYACGCSTAGAQSKLCDTRSGRCECKGNYAGVRCDTCAPGYYGYPSCVPCKCNAEGSRSQTCNSQSGQCYCKPIYAGSACDKCLPGFYDFPSCRQCNCNPAGTVPGQGGRLGDCSTNNNGQCECKRYVQGIECSQCKPGYYQLEESNSHGCTKCSCHRPGTNNGLSVCADGGQCSCKLNVGSRGCRECKDGYYNLKEYNMFGCQDCDCDIGGSIDRACLKNGQCRCNPNISGRRCNRPAVNYYFPTLHHIIAEIEDGFTSNGDAIPFLYQESKFPGYTWKGFVSMNNIQVNNKRRSRRGALKSSVVLSITVPRACAGRAASYYQVLFRYALNQMEAVRGFIAVYRKDAGAPYIGVIDFVTTQKGNGYTVAYAKVTDDNGIVKHFKLTPGKWNVEITVPSSKLLLDHVVMLPREYTDASSLSKRIETPCEVNTLDPFCKMYQYISLDKPGFRTIEAERTGRYKRVKPRHLFNDTDVLSKLNFKTMVMLSPKSRQQDILFQIEKPGRYVAVIQYYHDSDDVKNLDIYIRSQSDVYRGKAWLYSCRYTFGCRQAVLDRYNTDVAVFNIKTRSTHLLSFISKTDTSVALDSIILIPYDEWHLDYATPRPYCVTKDGKCMKSDYIKPRNVKIFLTPQDIFNTNRKPSYLMDPNTKVNYLQSGRNTITVNGIRAGKYHIIVHYYQPNHPSYTISTGIRGSGLRTQLKLDFCPNVNGCRQKLTSTNNNAFTFEDGDSTFIFDVPSQRNVWFEYIMFIPEGSSYINELFQMVPHKLSKDFIQRCAGKDYVIAANAASFCRDAVFTLTTSCNGGVNECSCNMSGSLSNKCEEFGGQCPCRDNIIGRTCTRCKIGFYGFPNCKACNCSKCDDVTGKCSCPRNVVGESCDKCAPGTFGYDAVIGCQPCNCDVRGTGKTDAMCNATDGQCPCLLNYGSRKCSGCAVGFYNYPMCLKCDCLVAGTTPDVCDVNAGSCSCQKNVIGSRCADSKLGFFKTAEAKAAKFAIKCWCEGRSSTCVEAQLYRKNITSSGAWKLSVKDIPVETYQATGKSDETFKFPKSSQVFKANISARPKSKTAETVYWIAPAEFLGNKASSYGGKFSYDFAYSIVGDVVTPVNERLDAIIEGRSFKMLSYQPLFRKPGKVQTYTTVFTEDKWLAEDGTAISRHQLMLVLSNIKSISIRATHDRNTETTMISNVVMGTTSTQRGGEQVFGQEQCHCKGGYTGLSCSLCSAGYTRQRDGTCGKCQCSGKGTVCHPETGKCSQCTGDSTGDQCEKCKPGYYGDKCKRCECPSGDPSNNFATSCGISLTEGALVCQCKPGYTGKRCETCANNYFGKPKEMGSSCKQCACNGNVNPSFSGNCDHLTGECYRCINNTHGRSCEVCRPGFYGDALKRTCKNCECNLCGSTVEPCDKTTGQCKCKVNVVGKDCSTCKPNTWNFNACKGCQECRCGAASLSSQCNKTTGRCQCKATVIGKQCNSCALGYYGYTAAGCKKCNCGGSYCDVNTGKCDCGVKGENCTLCPAGYIIEKGKCVECSTCVQNTLKRVNKMLKSGTLLSLAAINVTLSQKVLDELKDKVSRAGDAAAIAYEKGLEDRKKLLGFQKYGIINCLTKTANKTQGIPSQIVGKERCWRKCGGAGSCPTFCGKHGFCCRKGFNDPGCTEALQNTAVSTDHVCILTSAVGVPACPAFQDLKATEKAVSVTGKVLEKIESDAYTALRAVRETNKRDLLDLVKGYVKKLNEILKFMNDSVDINSAKGAGLDKDNSIKLIKKHLAEQRAIGVNITATVAAANQEMQSAENATKIAKNLRDMAMRVQDKINKWQNSVKDLLAAFKLLNVESSGSMKNADSALAALNAAKTFEYKTLVDLAEKMDKRNKVTLEDAKTIFKAGEDSFNIYKAAIELFKAKVGPLSDLLKKLRKFQKDLTEGLKAGAADVDKATAHAEDLKNLSQLLQKAFQDTKSFAATALEASKRYSTIVRAIYDALDAAKGARDTADEAKQKAKSANGVTGNLLKKSKKLNEDAKNVKERVKNELKGPLEGLKLKLSNLKKLRERIQTQLDGVKSDLNALDKDTGKRAADLLSTVANVATSGKALAKKTKDQVVNDKKIVDKLKSGIPEVNKLIKDAVSKSSKLSEKTPDLKSTINILNSDLSALDKTLENNVSNSVKYIKYLLASTNRVIDDIPLSMQFNTSSRLVLPSPKAVYEPLINVKVSLTFKQEVEGDAMLLFMGNGGDPDNNGHITIDIKGKKVRFHMKGDKGGADNVVEIPKDIKKQTWYKVTAERNAMFYTIRIATDDAGKLVNESMFRNESLDKIPHSITFGKNADVWLGSIPAGKPKPKQLSDATFVGCMDKYEVNNAVMGFWKWKDAKDVGGCARKVRMKDKGEYCFDGKGFVNLVPYKENQFSKVDLQFVTLSKSGLLILAVDPATQTNNKAAFYSLEMKDGYLVSKYDFGGGMKTIQHTKAGKLNDGVPHVFRLKEKRGVVRVFVEGVSVNEENIQPGDGRFNAGKVYIGGVPMDFKQEIPPNVISKAGFIGCMKSIVLKGVGNSLNTVDYGIGFRRGFENPKGRTASFPTKKSFMDVPGFDLSATKDKRKSLMFSFQTLQKNGQLLKADQLALKVRDGKVEMTVGGDKGNARRKRRNVVKRVITTSSNLADGKWHHISITNKFGNELVLTVDGEILTISFDPPLFSLGGKQNSVLRFGDKQNSFNGNIRQLIAGDKEVDLYTATQNGTQISSLSATAPLVMTPIPTKAPLTTTEAPVITTTKAPVITTTKAQVVTTTKAPVVTTTKAPVVTTTKAPVVTTTKAPVVTTTKAPVVTTTKAPVVTTTKAPVVTTTTKAPVVTTTTKAPVVSTTTKAPVTTTTKAPVTTTTKAPVTTTKAPVTTTTKAPVTTTTKAPVTTTTKAPVTTTTKAPVVTTTTKAPVVTTTKAPVVTTTKAPVITTTKAPVITTTKAPVITTTKAPVITTTKAPVVTTTKAPVPVCKSDNPQSLPNGYGFGIADESYIAFNVTPRDLETVSEYEFSFYTFARDGALLSVSMKRVYDYEQIYLDGGKIKYHFNAGSGSMILQSPFAYNNGKWHKVRTKRNRKSGTLYINDVEIKSGQSAGGSTAVNNIKQVYVGGVPKDALTKLPKESRTLKGGIKDVKINGVAKTPDQKVSLAPAYVDGLNAGAQFAKSGGYVERKNVKQIGVDFELAMKVRSLSRQGYIFYAAGTGAKPDGLTLQVINGELILECENGGGLFKVAVRPKTSWCNGEWHTVIVLKRGKTITLTCDETSNTVTSQGSSREANTGKAPFYIGGMPRKLQPTAYQHFYGCIKDIKVRRQTLDLTTADTTAGGGAMLGCGA